MKNLAEAGLEVICYNFMPVVDWTRTDLRFSAPNGGLALRFDPIDFATYDMFILNRPNADSSYSTDVISLAEVRFKELNVQDIKVLEQNIIAGLPGSEGSHTREGISKCIAKFYGFSNTDLRRNLISFWVKLFLWPTSWVLGWAFIQMIHRFLYLGCLGS